MLCAKCGKKIPFGKLYCDACGRQKQEQEHREGRGGSNDTGAVKFLVGVLAMFVVAWIIMPILKDSYNYRCYLSIDPTATNYQDKRDISKLRADLQIVNKHMIDSLTTRDRVIYLPIYREIASLMPTTEPWLEARESRKRGKNMLSAPIAVEAQEKLLISQILKDGGEEEYRKVFDYLVKIDREQSAQIVQNYYSEQDYAYLKRIQEKFQREEKIMLIKERSRDDKYRCGMVVDYWNFSSGNSHGLVGTRNDMLLNVYHLMQREKPQVSALAPRYLLATCYRFGWGGFKRNREKALVLLPTSLVYRSFCSKYRGYYKLAKAYYAYREPCLAVRDMQENQEVKLQAMNTIFSLPVYGPDTRPECRRELRWEDGIEYLLDVPIKSKNGLRRHSHDTSRHEKIKGDYYELMELNNSGVFHENKGNLSRAFMCYKKAGSLGSLRAQRNLARLFWYGKGVEQDIGKAKEIYENVATTPLHNLKREEREDVAIAAARLAIAHYSGVGGKADAQEARKYYQIVRKAREGLSSFVVGVCYGVFEEGLATDKADAQRLLMRAASTSAEDELYALRLNHYFDDALLIKDYKFIRFPTALKPRFAPIRANRDKTPWPFLGNGRGCAGIIKERGMRNKR